MTIPAECLVKEVLTFDIVMSIYSEPTNRWDLNYEQDGIRFFRKLENGLLCIREEAIIRAPMTAIFSYLIDMNYYHEFYKHIASIQLLKTYSPRAWAKLVKFTKKPILAQRYIVTLDHWCQLSDGRVVIHSRSEQLDHLHEKLDSKSYYRGTLHFNGFVIEPRGDAGYLVTFIHKMDMKGSLPSAVVNRTMESSVSGKYGLCRLRETLSNLYSDEVALPPAPTYQELESIACVVFGIKSPELVDWTDETIPGEEQDALRTSLFVVPFNERRNGRTSQINLSETRLNADSMTNSDRGTIPRFSDVVDEDTGLSARYTKEGTAVYERVMEFANPSYAGWEPWFEKDHVVFRRLQDGSGDQTTMRQDSLIHAPLTAIFQYLLDVRNLPDFNPDMYYAETIKVFSPHLYARLIKFKSTSLPIPLPVRARYMVTINHWRLLGDGKLLLISRSDTSDELYTPPSEEGSLVKANLHYAGFIIESKGPLGCLVSYIRKIDMGGALIPPVVVDTATRMHPFPALASMAKAVQQIDSAGRKQRLYGNTLLDCRYDNLKEIAEITLQSDEAQKLDKGNKQNKEVAGLALTVDRAIENISDGLNTLFHTLR